MHEIKRFELATTYSPSPEQSTIGTTELNFRVRNENGCTPLAESPTYKTHQLNFKCFFVARLFRAVTAYPIFICELC